MPADPQLKEQVEGPDRDNDVLLFMKGTPEAPRCGFSMRVVQILEAVGVEYGAVDVLPGAAAAARGDDRAQRLADLPPALRQGRAGRRRDIVEEMLDSGELGPLLGVEQPEADVPETEKILPGGTQTSPPMQLG